ncbi:MAG: hypothetical protein NTY12_03530 [Candidatus Falkowbacteria bacterium]|nr:hypothetical protein [Candidatus Falkowbacteria bacterium]
MRILTFLGDYSYIDKEVHSGLVCFCHFDKEESSEKIEKIVLKLLDVAGSLKIVIVPFAHLYENVIEPTLAQALFIRLSEGLAKYNKEVYLAPFGITKALHLDVSADDSAIRFFNF